MSKTELSELIRATLAGGNAPAIQVIPAGQTAMPVGRSLTASARDELLTHCRCGCHGDYTDHSMRLAERGIY